MLSAALEPRKPSSMAVPLQAFRSDMPAINKKDTRGGRSEIVLATVYYLYVHSFGKRSLRIALSMQIKYKNVERAFLRANGCNRLSASRELVINGLVCLYFDGLLRSYLEIEGYLYVFAFKCHVRGQICFQILWNGINFVLQIFLK